MKISKRMQLHLVWAEEVCWEALPVQLQQQLKGIDHHVVAPGSQQEGDEQQ
jgi:hypothetical protein